MSVRRVSLAALAAVFLALPPAWGDVFGTGANQFTIPFVPISGGTNPTDTSPSGGYGVVDYDYRMGVYQITNAQWDAFEAESGLSLGSSTWPGKYGGFDPSTQPFHTGFRVASVIPEPGSATMLLAGTAGLLLWRRRRRAGP